MQVLKRVAGFLPDPMRAALINRWRRYKGNPEANLLVKLCDPTKVSIDIGANGGSYTKIMAANSRECIAFEPVPGLAEKIRHECEGMNVRVYDCALSDVEGEATLRIPLCTWGDSPQNASIESDDITIAKHETKQLIVSRRRLDSFDFGSISVIKTDVEGHEEAVLSGASGVLERHHPTVTAELDETRHKPGCVTTVKSFLSQLGYRGFFINGRLIEPIENFDPIVHQNPSSLDENDFVLPGSIYIDTFIFAKTAEHLAWIEKFSKDKLTL